MTDLLQTTEATVLALEGDHVQTDVLEDACQMLQTSSAPPPVLEVGDRVLVAVTGSASYVLGRIGAPRAAPSRTETAVVVAPDGVEAVRIAGRRVTVAADDELVLECAGGSVRIDASGKVVVLGTDITSRARRVHKIKGAAVAIN